MAIRKICAALFIGFINLNLFSEELYNDGTCSLTVEELSESDFKICYKCGNKETEYSETSPTKYNFYWVSDDLARIDFGSPFAPDLRSYFFSRKLKKISKRKDFATAVLDLKNFKVLCADIEVTVEDIFSDYKTTVDLPYDVYPCSCKFFIIDEKSSLDNNNLKLFYLADDESLQCESIKLAE